MHSPLELTLVLLAAAVFGVVAFRMLQLPPILGYLAVGILIGPHALGLASDSGQTKYLAEFGVVFLMFSIGLEFSLPKLRAMRKQVFGLGLLQVAATMLAAVIGTLVLVDAAVIAGRDVAASRLLARQALLETPTCPERTIEQASVWADCVKPLGQRFSYAYNWRYQNVNICKPFTLKGNCPDGNCVSAQIERDGTSGAVESSMLTGYAPELRGDGARYATFRARWLGNDPGSFAEIYRMLTRLDMEDELRALACPVLVIGGTYDRVRPPAAAEAVAKLIPGARYRELPTGHYMATATPELVADAVNDFLVSVGA